MLTNTIRLFSGPIGDACDVVAVLVRPAVDGAAFELPGDASALSAVDIQAFLTREKFTGDAGEIAALPTHADEGVRLLLFAGIGPALSPAIRKAAAAVARRARDHARLRVDVRGLDAGQVATFAESAQLASYRFTMKSEPKPIALEEISLLVDNPPTATETAAVETAAGQGSAVGDPGVERAVADAGVRATAVTVARDLANTPSGHKSPQSLADEATRIAAESGLEVRVWNERDLLDGGFGGIAGVGMGSAQPPRLIQLSYRPDGATRHVVLVGKGITFDSGGLSIKPADGMPLMKTDMSGGATVLAVLGALRRLRCPIAVTGLVAAAENMPSGSALRPGDVVHHFGGRTSEVLNTDAEGRLVLADAIAYAVAELAPDAIVDFATLTGAATLGLGKRHAAFYATDEALATELLAAATVAGENWWRMPLVDEYRFTLDSPIADLSNIGTDPHVSGGSIVAALYLREFAGAVPWAHLDMAGPARADRDEDDVTKGATGYAVRTLLQWLAGPPDVPAT
ncbi:MAG: leucyl aminopeptidase [Frankiaceae bacterium]|nr:leucyl aminopeptidase [Frankiaceae bacterium]